MIALNKYGNRKVQSPDGVFDSVKEYRRWKELRLLERAGEISNLHRQMAFTLIPSQKINGKLIEREVKYYADFTYVTKDGEFVVEDAKSDGTRTQVYRLKKKLMLKVHGIQIKEV